MQTNTKIYMENPERKKPQAAMSKESGIVMREYKIDLRAIYLKKRSINDYQFKCNAVSQNKNGRTNS